MQRRTQGETKRERETLEEENGKWKMENGRGRDQRKRTVACEECERGASRWLNEQKVAKTATSQGGNESRFI